MAKNIVDCVVESPTVVRAGGFDKDSDTTRGLTALLCHICTLPFQMDTHLLLVTTGRPR